MYKYYFGGKGETALRKIGSPEIMERTFRRTMVEMALARELRKFFENGLPLKRLQNFVAQDIEQILVMGLE